MSWWLPNAVAASSLKNPVNSLTSFHGYRSMPRRHRRTAHLLMWFRSHDGIAFPHTMQPTLISRSAGVSRLRQGTQSTVDPIVKTAKWLSISE